MCIIMKSKKKVFVYSTKTTLSIVMLLQKDLCSLHYYKNLLAKFLTEEKCFIIQNKKNVLLFKIKK